MVSVTSLTVFESILPHVSISPEILVVTGSQRDDKCSHSPTLPLSHSPTLPLSHSPTLEYMSRPEKLEAMLLDDPTDTFLRYSLAMEHRSEGDHTESLERLGELTRDTTPYVPAFFMAAQQLVDLDRISEARTLLRDGITEARRQGDSHAAAEMSELLASLGSRGESAADSADDDDL